MALRAAPAAPRSRGRPKGSGIDDVGRLLRIRELMADDQALKPTTAMRQLGITDPSDVRRLRDKLSISSDVETKSEASSPVRGLERKMLHDPVVEPDKKSRETELLIAYLEALAKSEAQKAASEEKKVAPRENVRGQPERGQPSPQPKAQAPNDPPRPSQSDTHSAAAGSPFGFPSFPGFGTMPGFPSLSGMPQMPGFQFPSFPGMSSFQGMPQMPSFPVMSIPGFPSFMQPFQQKAAPPQPGTAGFRQLEAFKLAVEAMTAVARLQLHLIENAPAYAPMALMLQGQTFVGQMMIAAMTGQLDAMRRQGGGS